MLFLGVLIPTAAAAVFITLSRASDMLVVLLVDPFRYCHCWLVHVRLLLCCYWIPLGVFHLGAAFSSNSSSTWSASAAWASILSTSSTHPSSRLLPTPHCSSPPCIAGTSMLLKGQAGWGWRLTWSCCCCGPHGDGVANGERPTWLCCLLIRDPILRLLLPVYIDERSCCSCCSLCFVWCKCCSLIGSSTSLESGHHCWLFRIF